LGPKIGYVLKQGLQSVNLALGTGKWRRDRQAYVNNT